MNIYYVGKTGDGKVVCLEQMTHVHGAENADRAVELLEGGMDLGELDAMICNYCGNFLDKGSHINCE